jgi:hypothetical protein
MEIFKALMQVFVGVAGLNIILSFVLWRTNKYRPCLYMVFYWVMILVDFFVQGAVADQPPFYRILAISTYQFLFHYSLALTLASLLNIALPLKKYLFFQFLRLLAY